MLSRVRLPTLRGFGHIVTAITAILRRPKGVTMTSNAETMAEKDEDGVTMGWMSPRYYDVLLCCYTRGRESRQRQEILDHAAIQPGESVLDVGCGTGTLAIMAADTGADKILGVDPSPSMIRRAKHKAGKDRPNIEFEVGRCQALSADDDTFDVVLTTFTLHHIPGDEIQKKSLDEINRVLVPGGRLLLVDFPPGHHHGHHHDHHHHGHHHHGRHNSPKEGGETEDNKADDFIVSLVKNAGFENVTSQSVSMLGAVAVLAYKPEGQNQ